MLLRQALAVVRARSIEQQNTRTAADTIPPQGGFDQFARDLNNAILNQGEYNSFDDALFSVQVSSY